MTRVPAQAPYDPSWPDQAQAEARRWRAALGDEFVACHHIGSTAVPGLPAKPIIDLIPVARDLAALDAARPAIEAMGYAWMGAFGLPGRRHCRLTTGGVRRVNVHAYADGSPEITRHLAFRDYLRADPSRREAYAALKARCAAQSATMDAYCDCKDAWIKEHEAKALEAMT